MRCFKQVDSPFQICLTLISKGKVGPRLQKLLPKA